MSLTANDLKAIAGIVDNSVDKAIETKVRPMFVSLAQQITLLSDATAAGFNQVYERFDDMDLRFDRIETRLTAVENDTSRLRGNFSGLLTKVTLIESNISIIQKDVSRIDRRVTRVEGSATQIGGRVTRIEAFLLPPSNKPKAMSGLSRALKSKTA